MKKCFTLLLIAFLSLSWLGIHVSASVPGMDDPIERIGPKEKPWRLAQRTNEDVLLKTKATEFLSEDFSANELPPGWTAEEEGDPGLGWEFNDELAFIDSDDAGSGPRVAGSLTTPALDLSNTTSVTLAMNHYFRPLSSTDGRIRVSTDGTNWTDAFDFDSVEGDDSYPLIEYDITDLAAGEETVYIQFYYDDNSQWAWYWEIDNIHVYGTQDEGSPVPLPVSNTAVYITVLLSTMFLFFRFRRIFS